MLFRYISGNKINHAVSTGYKVLKTGKIPVLNYAVENSSNSLKLFNEYENLCNSINSEFKIALKLSSFNFDLNIANDIIDMYKSKNIRILVDAEDNESDHIYQENINRLMEIHNKDNANILKTYQMYRKDSLNVLKNDIYNFNKSDIYLGVKLVRGAYWNSENKLGHLFVQKEDTDFNYNQGIMELYKNKENKLYNILATHNSESINLGILLNDDNLFEFGHLLGMKENKYDCVKENNKVNVYIPYGPYSEMIPYLGRRLYENLDTIKYILR